MNQLTNELHPPDAARWPSIRELLVGSKRDFTTGPLSRAVVILAIPMVLEMLMQSVFELADIYFVGRLGPDALAAAGLTASVIVLVFAIAIGLSMGIAATVSRRIGEKNPEEAAEASYQAILLAIVVSIPVAIVGIVFAREALLFMGATEHVADIGRGYFALTFGANIVVVLLFMLNAIFRGAGDAAFALRALFIANTLNIVLDPILIFGLGPIPALGLFGAGVATVIGRAVGIAVQLHLLTSGRGNLTLRLKSYRPQAERLKRLIRISLPAVAQFFVGTASWMLIMRLVSQFGTNATAGYTVAIRVIVFALLPSWGMGNAAAALVGQCLGADKPDRAEKAVWMTSLANTAFLTVCGILLFFFAPEAVRLFTNDPAAVDIGALCLRTIAFSYPFYGFGMVVVQAFNGAGDTSTPTAINLIAFWIVQIPLGYVLSLPLDFGPKGVFIAIAIAQSLLAIIAVAWFRRGKWKSVVV
ncbi:MAG: MATE family efflux transporter [Rhodothermales bacterium]